MRHPRRSFVASLFVLIDYLLDKNRKCEMASSRPLTRQQAEKLREASATASRAKTPKPFNAMDFVELLCKINDDCYLIIASMWSPLDLMNLLRTFPNLKHRVHEAFQARTEFTFNPYIRTDKDIRKVATALLMCGRSLRQVRYRSFNICDSYCKTPLCEFQTINLATLARGRKHFGQQLARACPNIELFGVFSKNWKRYVDHVRVLADYAENLSGKCKLQKLYIPTRFVQLEDMQLFYRVLRNCNALKDVVLNIGHAFEPQLQLEMVSYQNKPREADVERIEIDGVPSENYLRICIDVFEMFTKLVNVSIELKLNFYEYENQIPLVSRIAELVSNSDTIRTLTLETNSLEILNNFNEDLITELQLTYVLDNEQANQENIVRGKQFKNLTQLRLQLLDENYDFVTESQVFRHVKDIDIWGGDPPTFEFLEAKGSLISNLKLTLEFEHEAFLDMVTKTCVNLHDAYLTIIDDHLELDYPDIDLLRKLNTINPGRSDSSVELRFHHKKILDRYYAVYNGIVQEAIENRTTLKLFLE